MDSLHFHIKFVVSGKLPLRPLLPETLMELMPFQSFQLPPNFLLQIKTLLEMELRSGIWVKVLILHQLVSSIHLPLVKSLTSTIMV
jgi:hypothetical protein